MSGDEVASAIDDFLGDRGGPYAWDEFISTPLSDPSLEQLAAQAREYARGTSST